MTTLEERIQRLEDLETIRALTMSLARHFDNDYDADAIIGLVTEDAELNIGPFGVYRGRDEIHAFFKGVSEQITFAKHHLATHTIDLAPSGSEAAGLWYMWGTHTVGGRAMFLGLNWDIRYRKIDGSWLIEHQKFDFQFFTPYESGWVKEQMAV